MAIKTKITCDKCKKDCSNEVSKYIRFFSWSVFDNIIEYDLCKNCYNNVKTVVNIFIKGVK